MQGLRIVGYILRRPDLEPLKDKGPMSSKGVVKRILKLYARVLALDNLSSKLFSGSVLDGHSSDLPTRLLCRVCGHRRYYHPGGTINHTLGLPVPQKPPLQPVSRNQCGYTYVREQLHQRKPRIPGILCSLPPRYTAHHCSRLNELCSLSMPR